MIQDLLTTEDRKIIGWPLLITDVLALVEQRVMVHATFFWGDPSSSLAGGVMNARAVRGVDPRASWIGF